MTLFIIGAVVIGWIALGVVVAVMACKASAFGNGKDTMSEEAYYGDYKFPKTNI